jgi:hypothetical protein
MRYLYLVWYMGHHGGPWRLRLVTASKRHANSLAAGMIGNDGIASKSEVRREHNIWVSKGKTLNWAPAPNEMPF